MGSIRRLSMTRIRWYSLRDDTTKNAWDRSDDFIDEDIDEEEMVGKGLNKKGWHRLLTTSSKWEKSIGTGEGVCGRDVEKRGEECSEPLAANTVWGAFNTDSALDKSTRKKAGHSTRGWGQGGWGRIRGRGVVFVGHGQRGRRRVKRSKGIWLCQNGEADGGGSQLKYVWDSTKASQFKYDDKCTVCDRMS